MKRINVKVGCLTVALLLVLSLTGELNLFNNVVTAATATSTLYAESFENYNLDELPSDWKKVTGSAATDTDYGVVAVDPINLSNKVLKIKKTKTGTGTIVGATKTIRNLNNQMSVKFSYMTPSTGPYFNLYMGLSNCISFVQTSNKFYFVGTANTVVKSDVTSNTWYNIELRIDNTTHLLDCYINNISVGSNIAYRNNNDMDRFSFTIGDTVTGEYYIDNVEVANALITDDDLGDYTYFNNHEMNTSTDTYMNFTALPTPLPTTSTIPTNTNSIICNRYDYKNPIHNNYIIMNKVTTSQCYFNVSLIKDYHYQSTKTYTNFLIEGDFMLEKLGNDMQMFYLANSSVNTVVATILTNGDLKFSDNTVIAGFAKQGVWFNYKVALDLANHKADIYVDNVLIKQNLPLMSTLTSLTTVRLSLVSGSSSSTAKLNIDNLKVQGLVLPYQNGVLNKTSIFSDNKSVIDYLGDKVAFQAYRGTMFANGTKIQLNPMPYYDKANNVLYVSVDVLGVAFGINPSQLTITKDSNVVTYNGTEKTLDHSVIEVNSTLVVPVKDFATEMLAKYVNDDTLGLQLFSNYPVDIGDQTPFYLRNPSTTKFLDPSIAETINDYMFFERQNADSIKSIFNATTNNGATHPRLFAKKADFDRMKELVIPTASPALTPNAFNNIYYGVIARADEEITKAVISYTYDDDYRMRSACTAVMERMKLLGFAYQMTKDIKYVNRAWSDIQQMALFPDLNTSHPIDTGDFCTGLAFCYDLMHDGFTQEQRDTIANTVIRLGLKPLQSAYYGGMTSASAANPGWVYTKWTSNYNTVINGGAILAALAVAEKDPDLCFDVVEKGLRSLEYTFKGFPPEGGWIEGYSYCGEFVAAYLCYITTSLKNSTGTDMGLTKYCGIDGIGNFLTGLQAPQGVNNYHDTDITNNSTHQLTHWTASWLSSEFGNTGHAAFRQLWITQRGKTPDPMDAVFYIQNVSLTDLPLATTVKGVECFSIRESYSYVSGIFASGHFGAENGYHTQRDTGTFVFDVAGQRWAVDLGKDNYNAGLSDDKLYRKRPEGHNVVVINPDTTPGQNDNTFTPIEKFQYNSEQGFAVADLTKVYNDVNSYKRGFYVGDSKRSLTIRDEMDLKASSTVYWFMHTKADVSIQNGIATLTQGGKSLKLSFATNVTQSDIYVMDAVGLPESQLPTGQSDNTGYRKVVIKLTDAAGATDLTVKLAPVGEAAENTPIIITPISDWLLTATLNSPIAYTSSPTKVNASVAYTGNSKVALVIAEYMGNKLINIKITQATQGADGSLQCEMIRVSTKSTIKIFALNDLYSFIPLGLQKILTG